MDNHDRVELYRSRVSADFPQLDADEVGALAAVMAIREVTRKDPGFAKHYFETAVRVQEKFPGIAAKLSPDQRAELDRDYFTLPACQNEPGLTLIAVGVE